MAISEEENIVLNMAQNTFMKESEDLAAIIQQPHEKQFK